jgi:outer membrane protein assembly factor BamA
MKSEADLKTTASRPEPKTVVIDSIDFDGPISLPAPIRDQLIAEANQLEIDACSNWVDEVGEVVIRKAWQDQGYFRAEATVEARVVIDDPASQHVALTVHVDEGPQFFLGDLVFRSSDPDEPLAFGTDELRKQVPLQLGDIFDVDKIRQSFDALRQLYGSQGYIDFAAEPSFSLDDARQRISMTIVLDQETQFHIGSVEVIGLNSSAEIALRSHVKPGDLFDFNFLKRFFEKNKSTLPNDASLNDVSLKRNAKTGTVDLTFNFFTCPQIQD